MESIIDGKDTFKVHRSTALNATECTDIASLVKNELSVFTKTGNSFSLVQRALLILTNCGPDSTSMLGAVADAVKDSSAPWIIKVIPRSNDQTDFSLFNYLPIGTVVKVAIRARLIRYLPWIPSLIALVSMGFMILFLSGFFTNNALVYSLAIGAAAIVWGVVYDIDLKRGALGTKVLSAIKARGNESSVQMFSELLAEDFTTYLPAAILVEDIGKLDFISKKVVEYLLNAPQKSSIGSILWIVFESEDGSASEIFKRRASFPVKQYTFGGVE